MGGLLYIRLEVIEKYYVVCCSWPRRIRNLQQWIAGCMTFMTFRADNNICPMVRIFGTIHLIVRGLAASPVEYCGRTSVIHLMNLCGGGWEANRLEYNWKRQKATEASARVLQFVKVPDLRAAGVSWILGWISNVFDEIRTRKRLNYPPKLSALRV